ncbi:MAG: FecR domain-containing protein [Clostridia bacterium]|nr:FecR domain-containing protein [Clostridia bacterium]
MKKSALLKNKIISFILTLVLVVTNSTPLWAADTGRAAKITDLSGTVNVQKAGGEKKFSAFKGMSLSQGDSISTGKASWVELEIDNDKLVKISENTQLGVAELAGSIESGDDQTGLKLWFGKVWTNIKNKLNIRSKYEIRTPKTVMGVRGTQFFVSLDDEKTVVAVLEGKVYSVTYTTEQRPDGTVLERAVEAYINPNEQAVVDESAPLDSGITVQPVKLESLPSTILEEIKKSPEGIDPSLIQNIDQVIEQRRIEETRYEQLQQQQIQQTQPPVPQITPDPGVTSPAPSPAPSSGSNSGSTVAPPRISTIDVQNGYINLLFDQSLTTAPLTTDFEVFQDSGTSPVRMTINNVNWNGYRAVNLSVSPLQPGDTNTTFRYTVKYKGDAGTHSSSIEIPAIQSANVTVSGSSIVSGNSAQITIRDIRDTTNTILNNNHIYDNSVFNVGITSDLENSAQAVFTDVEIDANGNVLSPALGINLTTVGTHRLTVTLNGKVLTNSLTIDVVSNTPPPPSTTLRISSVSRASLSTSGGNPNNDSDNVWLSRNGRKIAFSSFASNLVTGDTNNVRDVFVYDRIAQSTSRVSLNSLGNQINGGSSYSFINNDGRYVVFTSTASNLVSGDTNAGSDVFVRDLASNTNYRVSLSDQNAEVNPGGGFYADPQISDDGRYVAFTYTQDNLVQGDTNSNWDVFVRDRQTDTTRLVSVSSTGTQAASSSHLNSISGDGRFIAFNTGSLLTPDATGAGIYIRDLTTNTTKWMVEGGNAYLSTNGRFMAFTSFESDLVNGDTNGCTDVFVLDRDTDNNNIYDESGKTEIKRVSISSSGEQANYHCYRPQISDDGRYVAYYSSASNLVNGDTNNVEDVFVYDQLTRRTHRVSTTVSGIQSNAGSGSPSISADGRFITFCSEASNLVAGDTNNRVDVFLVELQLDAPLDTTPPTAPSNIAEVNVGPTWVKISWDPSTDDIGISSYEIYRGVSLSGPFSKIATVSNATLSYWDTTLTEGSQYYYYVKAINVDGLLSPVPIPATISTPLLTVSPPQELKLAAGRSHSILRKNDGSIWAWGLNNKGQLGIGSPGTISQTTEPTQVLGYGGTGNLLNISAVEAGEYFTAALKSDGTIWTWGDNSYGQLGVSTGTTSRSFPGQVAGLFNIKAVSAGVNHTVVLKSDGTVWAWGQNNYGQLGNGTTTNASNPTAVVSSDGSGYLTGITAISAGDYHTAVLRNDGTVWVYGSNHYGQLGKGAMDTDSHTIPAQVTGLPSNIIAIASGGNFILALTADGYLWAWGENYNGQLGDNTTTCRYSPIQVKGLGGTGLLNSIVSFNAGSVHSLAVSNTGQVYAWGNNNRGKLGDNDISETDKPAPVQVLGEGGTGNLTGVTFVTAGRDHSLALKSDGTILTWGDGYSGQLGNGLTSTFRYPVQANCAAVPPPSGSTLLNGEYITAFRVENEVSISGTFIGNDNVEVTIFDGSMPIITQVNIVNPITGGIESFHKASVLPSVLNTLTYEVKVKSGSTVTRTFTGPITWMNHVTLGMDGSSLVVEGEVYSPDDKVKLTVEKDNGSGGRTVYYPALDNWSINWIDVPGGIMANQVLANLGSLPDGTYDIVMSFKQVNSSDYFGVVVGYVTVESGVVTDVENNTW